MRERCPVCRGSQSIRLPLYQESALGYQPANIQPTFEVSYRDYPCPECSEKVREDHVVVVQNALHTDERYATGPEMVAIVRSDLAHALAQKMLENGLIDFKEERNHAEMRLETTARIGVASKVFVASIEQRVNAARFEVAEKVLAAAKEGIRNWDSHYRGRDGSIKKDQAGSLGAAHTRRECWGSRWSTDYASAASFGPGGLFVYAVHGSECRAS